MNKLVLILMLFVTGISGYCATWTITNVGTSFSPDDLTINLGDEVQFNIESIHTVVEVSLATWNANGRTQLSGGFSLPSGGGLIPASKLTAGIHYYVCGPHSSSGMKGKITVVNTTGISENQSKAGMLVFPNPTNGNFLVKITNPNPVKEYEIEIYNVLGKPMFSKTDLQQPGVFTVDLADLPKGTYVVRLYDGQAASFRKVVLK